MTLPVGNFEFATRSYAVASMAPAGSKLLVAIATENHNRCARRPDTHEKSTCRKNDLMRRREMIQSARHTATIQARAMHSAVLLRIFTSGCTVISCFDASWTGVSRATSTARCLQGFTGFIGRLRRPYLHTQMSDPIWKWAGDDALTCWLPT